VVLAEDLILWQSYNQFWYQNLFITNSNFIEISSEEGGWMEQAQDCAT
jgi:hypothetical protein